MQHLWKDHYVAGETGNFHGDMARAFARMLCDPCCDPRSAHKIQVAAKLHCGLERQSSYAGGRKWFCELFGTDSERNPDVARSAGIPEYHAAVAK